jgi:HSP20 family protein
MADTNTLTQQKDRVDASRPEATRGVTFTPRVDILETDQELTLYADLPGVRAEDVDLRFEQGELFLSARTPARGPQKETFLLNDYEVGDFYRAFTIHESIDASKISAEHKNGVLIVHLSKSEAVRPRQIKVRGS